MQFFRSVAQALVDFNELNPIAPLQLLLEVKKKTLYIKQVEILCNFVSIIIITYNLYNVKLHTLIFLYYKFRFQTLNMKKSLPLERLPVILYNIACYLDCLPLEAGLGPGAATWSGLLAQFDGLFRRLVLMLSSIEDITPLLRIIISILKVPGIQQSKV